MVGIGDRPAACASCGNRLGRKHWYYRNGKYFCNKRCWVAEEAKAAEKAESDKGKDASKEEQVKEQVPQPKQGGLSESQARPEAGEAQGKRESNETQPKSESDKGAEPAEKPKSDQEKPDAEK